MKKENTSTITLLLAFNICLVIIGLFVINNRIGDSDEKSDSLIFSPNSKFDLEIVFITLK